MLDDFVRRGKFMLDEDSVENLLCKGIFLSCLAHDQMKDFFPPKSFIRIS